MWVLLLAGLGLGSATALTLTAFQDNLVFFRSPSDVASERPGPDRLRFDVVMDGKPVGLLDRALYALGNVLVYGPLRNSLGLSRVRVAYTAGEAIGPDLFTFYKMSGCAG
jgi:long-chain acyl-CoA synthetase